MELATVLIGVVVFIISALMIYCISAVSMREKTFEEVIAEQRQRNEQEREKAKAEKKAEKELTKKKGFKKGKQEKVKEKSAQVSEPELKVEHKMVNLEIEPEIIEPTEAVSLGTVAKQRSVKKEKIKSIIVNKGEPSLIAQKQVELHHKPNVGKDEVELKKSHEKSNEKALSTNTKELPVQENMSNISVELKENLPPKGTPEKRKQKQNDEGHTSKSKQGPADAPLNGTRLISVVKATKLSDNEVQILLDILLSRQGLTPTEVWNTKTQKGDPVSVMEKQLKEKEKLLQEEKSNATGLMLRAKEMKNELTAEKTKSVALEKRYQDQLMQSQAEVEALKSRMQHTHEQHLQETNTLQARLHQFESDANQATAQKLSAENKILQDSLTIKSKETVSLGEKIKQLERTVNTSLSKVKTSDAAKKDIEGKVTMYEDKIRQLESMQKDVDAMVNQRVEDVTRELRKAESRNSSLTVELQNATEALGATQGEVTSLKAKLQELESHLTKADASKAGASKESEAKLQEYERKCLDLERNVKNLEKQLTDVSQRLEASSTELQSLQQENKTLSDANSILKEKVQTTSASTANGNAGQANEIGELSAGLESQKKTVATLKAQLDTKTAELGELQKQLSQQKAKNNELREKNWKAMEALEQSEKTASEKIEKALKSARDQGNSGADVEKYDKLVFQGLFPDIKVQGKLAHKEWVADFQKQAEKKLSTFTPYEQVQKIKGENKELASKVSEYEKQIQSSADSDRCSQLEDQNKKLQSDVDHYRSIVEDTEKKMHQLEKSIDEEEKKWHEKLKQAKSETQKGSGSTQKVSELESLVREQRSQMEDYRHVLSITESRLQELEKKVGAEETVWQGKLSASQKELSQTKTQLTSLKQELGTSGGSEEDLSDLGFAYRCVEKSLTSIVDEMKADNERLESALKQCEEKITILTKEKQTALTQLEGFQSQTDNSSELIQIRTQLESERKKNKDLSMNVVKLNGIIKTGQDALSQEQGLVRKLQESLDSKSMSSGISDIDEADQASSSTSENGTSV